MALSSAGRTEHEDVSSLGEPTVASGNCHDLRLRDHGYRVKGEAVQGLSGRQVRFGEMSFNPAIGTLCQLVLGNSRQEASGWPSFPVRLLGKLRPQRFDGR